MASAHLNEKSGLPSFDGYYETVQARKRLPKDLQEALNSAFAKIPVSSFPEVPGGKGFIDLGISSYVPHPLSMLQVVSKLHSKVSKVIEILADTSVADALQMLSEYNILSAPVRNPDADSTASWSDMYLGMVDYSAIILWVLENAELAAVALAAGSATAAGMGVGAVGALGALALGAAGPAAVIGSTIAAVGAAVAGGVAVEKGKGKDAPTAADYLGQDFYKVILKEEPFKSTTVGSIINSFRWTPFLPVQPNDSMLTVLLLLSKYRLRSIPIIEMDKPFVSNMITQSAVVRGLLQCKGRDWFDFIAMKPVHELGLPFMSPDKVVCIDGNALVLEAFKRMREHEIGGLPVVQGPRNKIIGNISMRDVRFLLLKQQLLSKFRQLTVLDFMTTFASAIDSDPYVMMPPITCKLDTSLGNVIEILASKCIHRIHLIDDQDELLGVITLRDVISCFVSEPEHHFKNYLGSIMKEMLSN